MLRKVAEPVATDGTSIFWGAWAESAASTVYGPPGRKFCKAYEPSPSETVVDLVPVGTWVTVTVTPPSGLPASSVTWPRTEPVVCCAYTAVDAASANAPSAAPAASRLINIDYPSRR